MNPVTPTPKQKENCESMGWEYIGDGLFSKGGDIGYFSNDKGWRVE